jgi:hypothetical protein
VRSDYRRSRNKIVAGTPVQRAFFSEPEITTRTELLLGERVHSSFPRSERINNMDFFGYLFGYDGYGYGGRSHWYGANEKSRHSKSREDEAKKKFDAMKRTMEATMIETAVNEERAEGSNSLLKKLPVDALNNVYGYLLGKEFERDENADVSKQLAKTAPFILPKARTGKTVGDKHLQFGVDFSDLTLYEPGNKITIPLTMPHFHLTQPCFRDLKKHVL